MEAGNRYYIATGRPWLWVEHMLNFLRKPRTYYVKPIHQESVEEELKFFGFSKGTHYEMSSSFPFVILSWKEATES